MAEQSRSIVASFTSIRIPPDEAAAIAALFAESMLIEWRRRRVGLSARIYRAQRELAHAFESEGGVKTLLYRSLAERRKKAPAPAGRGARRALARSG
jgi:hypothetical protein